MKLIGYFLLAILCFQCLLGARPMILEKTVDKIISVGPDNRALAAKKTDCAAKNANSTDKS